MSEQASQQGRLRNGGVYRIDHEGQAPEFLAALVNEDTRDYAYALARAFPIPGAGFAYEDSEFLIFVECESEEEPDTKLFTTFHDIDGLYDGRSISELIDTGLVAVSKGELDLSNTPPKEIDCTTPSAREVEAILAALRPLKERLDRQARFIKQMAEDENSTREMRAADTTAETAAADFTSLLEQVDALAMWVTRIERAKSQADAGGNLSEKGKS
jgi:hypothetical protein